MIVKLCIMNAWSSITKAKFQHPFLVFVFFLITILLLLLILSNDIELSPGPKKDCSNHNFSIAHGNVNNIAAQRFGKISQSEAYNTMHSCNLISLSDTLLDSTTSINSNYLSLKGYNLHGVDDPKNFKNGGGFVYCKETLAVNVL